MFEIDLKKICTNELKNWVKFEKLDKLKLTALISCL